MTITNEGLRIELTETANGIFFESGSDKLSADGGDLVRLLAQELGQLPNTIAIEGHTDAKPYPPGAIYTNWELSADLANSTRRLMQANGIRPDQVTQVRGFADQRLRNADAPLDPSNRRISLIVQYLEKKAEKDVKASPEAGKSPDSAATRDPSAPIPGAAVNPKK